MSSKNGTEVIIGGKVFKLSGYESEEYLQRIASYINGKISEYNNSDGFKRLPYDTQSVLLQINIADDYFKAKKQVETLEAELEAKDKELYDIKHELVTAQIKAESNQKTLKSLQDENNEAQKKIIELETRLSK